jgi:uncharacterized SAM-binding protein YcdF (DUF218 family)
VQRGVPAEAVAQSVPAMNSTREEARYVAAYVRDANVHRVIVVTSPYHTARAGRYFDQALGDKSEIAMRPSRYERIEPDRWWRHSIDRHDVLLEYMKFLYGFGFSS